MADDDRARAHTAESDTVMLQHESLRDITERVRVAWSGDGREGDTGRRAKRKLRDQAREFSGLALATLVDACISGDTSSARISAAKELLDRGFGKSVDHVEIDDKRDHAAAQMIEHMAQLQRNPDTAAALLSLAEASAKLSAKPRD